MRTLLFSVFLSLSAGLTHNAHAVHPDSDDIQRVLTRHQLPADALALVTLPLNGNVQGIAYNADKPVNPASVMKVVSTYAALDTLGPAYTWKTDLLTDGEVIGDTLQDRKSTRLNSSHVRISYAVFC